MNANIIIIVMVILLSICSVNSLEYRIYDSKTGKQIEDVESLVEQFDNYDVIFFGEYHDDALLHSLEEEIYSSFSKNCDNLALSMEMFERDNQQELDEYITGKIDYKTFSEKARLWPNHKEDYEPLLQIAIKNKHDVIAANVPRRYASSIAMQGQEALDRISEDEKKYVANKLVVLDDEYKVNFYETMQSMKTHGMKMKDQMILNFYKAQCLKDDTMAESIVEYLAENPKAKVLHINGEFHSTSHLGTAQKVKLLNNHLKIAVIAPVAMEIGQELIWKDDYKSLGDFIIIIEREEEKK